MTITDQSARFESFDPAEEPELARGLSLVERIKRFMADHESRTVQTIAEALGVDTETVGRIMRRYKGKYWLCLKAGGGRGQETTWATI